jgi:hypothetical protein
MTGYGVICRSSGFVAATTRAEVPMTSEDKAKLVEWMDEATGANSTVEVPHGTLSVTRFADAFWYLSQPIDWSPNAGQALPPVSVPKGFVTDFASIPRALWTSLPRDGDYVWAAVVHDYLYWFQTTTKEIADSVLKAAMVDFDIPALTRTAIYQGVNLGGASSWANNAQLRQNGEKRILKKFPDSPTISWEQWKTKPDVFAS